jgi:NAD(P)-dependent dehydrogenase (short-subunit alcohol dehydrogenase family)
MVSTIKSYAAVHANPQGPGDARPTALEIIRDEDLESQLTGKVIVMTGATSGIGLETARALSITGATLFLTTRDVRRAEVVFGEVFKRSEALLIEMDHASYSSVRTAAAAILERSKGQVNILINNAGIMGIRNLQLTGDGHEMHFVTNHLSHFLLFQLLKPVLLAAATADFPSRVVNVASSAHRSCTLPESDNYDFQAGVYSLESAYAQSKLANVYMANELDRRYGHKHLHATSLHPGAANTNISRYIGKEFVEQIMKDEAVYRVMKSHEQGAATTVIAAVGKEWADKGGRYLEDCQEAGRGKDDYNSFGVGYVRQTYDPVSERRLWEDSMRLVGMKSDM